MKTLLLIFGLCWALSVALADKSSKVYFYRQDGLSFNQFSVGTIKNLTIEEEEDLRNDIQDALVSLEDFANKIHTVGRRNQGGKRLREVINYDIMENTKCRSDMQKLDEDADAGELYALQIVDSWGRAQSGILEGNVRWPGSFYECRNAKGANFSGKYYTMFYGFKFAPSPLTVPMDVAFGTCWPDSCDDVSASMLMPDNFPNLPLLETMDSVLQNEYTASTIIAIIASLFFLMWALFGSMYHIYCNYRKIDAKQRNKILMCSSVFDNTSKICSTKKIPGTIPTLDGIRAITTAWVILGHSFYFIGNNIDNAITMGNSLSQRYLYMVIINGTFSVDTFFCIGGLLVCYLTLKQLRKPQGKMFVPMMYLKRYLRLTPLYAFLILFSVGLYKYLGDGPYWKHTAEKTQEMCQEDWWANLLYITTLYPIKNSCFGWGWYLSNDMMFFLLTPFIALIMNLSFYFGMTLLFAIVVCSIGLNAWLTAENNIPPTGIGSTQTFKVAYRISIDPSVQPTWEDKFTTDIYHLPWCRAGAYMVGMMAGGLLHAKNRKVKMSKIVVLLGWLLAWLFGVIIVYGIFGYTKDKELMSKDLNIFYNAMARPVWALCISWVVVACASGYGGPVTTILESKFFKPLSRLTYAAYLVHPLVAFWYSGTMEKPVHFSEYVLMYQFIGNITVSFVIAFVVALLVEWPMQEVLKLVLPKRQSGGKSENIGSDQPPVNAEVENGFKCSDAPHSSSSARRTSHTEAPPSYMEKQTYENEAYVKANGKAENFDSTVF